MAGEEASSQEKSEQPSEKKRADARKKGEVPRSRELNTMTSLMTAGVGLLFFGAYVASLLANELSVGLAISEHANLDSDLLLQAAEQSLSNGIVILAPVLVVMFLSVFVGPLLMGGFIFRLESLAPDIKRIDPLKGLGRIFSVNGLMEFLKAFLKFLVIGIVAWFYVSSIFDEVLGLGAENIERALAHSAGLLSKAFLLVSSVLVLVVALDVPFQLAQFTKKLKMTKQEVKDEMKETDGRPEVKSRIRALQQELSQRRMMESVKTADVVIRNPTHYAVALSYDDTGHRAPIVLARGRDLIALQIIKIAETHDVSIVSAPPLARALYSSTDIGQEIPAGLYMAIAQVLAYVYQLKDGKKPSLPVLAVDESEFVKGSPLESDHE